MKKTLCIVLAILMLLTFAACGQTTETDEEQGALIGNPRKDYESLDDINTICQTNLVKLGVMGVTDESFYIIDETIAEYRFKVSGQSYIFRGGKDETDDICGIYVDGGTAFADATHDQTNYADTGNYYAAQFFVGTVQYTLVTTAKEDGISFDSFKDMVDELCATVQEQ